MIIGLKKYFSKIKNKKIICEIKNNVKFKEMINWSQNDYKFKLGDKKDNKEEKKLGNILINTTNNKQWTTKLGEELVKQIFILKGNKVWRPEKKQHYIPDLETKDYIIEVKTISWTTTGTAGEKVFGTPFKYAEIPILYNKPLLIICVGYQEYEFIYGNTPIFGKNVRIQQKKFIDFYKDNNIKYIQFSKLVCSKLFTKK